MDRGTATRIEQEWDRREVGVGRGGLAKLGDLEFSGAVEASGTWLFMLNGRIVGESGGSVDTIGSDVPVIAYRAPHPSLPLLFAMQDRGGETEARYFTDDTPLAEVHETLSAGSFTGYIELSENVHSGDYHVVYYGGRALHAAFIGNAERLVTGEEAFERANDEVGIFEVRSVDLDVRDAPETEDDGGARASGGAAAVGAMSDESSDIQDAGTAEPDQAGSVDVDPDSESAPLEAYPNSEVVEADGATDDVETATETASETGPGSDTAGDSAAPVVPNSGEEVGTKSKSDSGHMGPEEGPGEGTSDASGSEFEEGRENRTESSEGSVGDDRSASVNTESDDAAEPGDADAGTTGQASDDPDLTGGVATGPGRTSDAGPNNEPGFDDEAAWREQKSVPALDPDRSGTTEQESGTADAHQGAPAPAKDEATVGPEETDVGRADDAQTPDPDRIHTLEAEVESLQERIESLSEERDDLRADRDRLAEERDHLQAQIQELKAADDGDESESERDLTPEETLKQTDLLVRYGSKSAETLADAHEGDAIPDSMGANLRLKTHTRFDADGVTVNGVAFESYLQGTLAYRFARWLVEDLLFEVRETDNRKELQDLYDALPEIDRVEFNGTVTVEDGSGETRAVAFDVVVRDQMGKPLLVADVDGDRDPTEGELIEGLLDRTAAVAETTGSLSAAFLVTASFFLNEVHEQVLDATRTGFLDRDSRASFVKAARTDGYHVCLVEAHDGEFHVSRPDL